MRNTPMSGTVALIQGEQAAASVVMLQHLHPAVRRVQDAPAKETTKAPPARYTVHAPAQATIPHSTPEQVSFYHVIYLTRSAPSCH